MGVTHVQETCARNWFKKLSPIERCFIPRKFWYFQTQPSNQTAQFWSRALLQVSGKSFFYKFLERVCVTSIRHVARDGHGSMFQHSGNK